MNRCMTAAGVALLLFLLSPLAISGDEVIAQERGRDIPPDLSEDQRERIEELRAAHAQEEISLASKIRIKRAELDALLLEEKPDRTAIHRKVDEIASLESAVRKEHIDTRLDIREVLTPQQRMRFDRGHLQGSQGPPDSHLSRMPGRASGWPGPGQGRSPRDAERRCPRDRERDGKKERGEWEGRREP
jgi:uncharacterized membrane protein